MHIPRKWSFYTPFKARLDKNYCFQFNLLWKLSGMVCAKIDALKTNTKEIVTVHPLWPNQTKIITLHANTKEIISLHTILWPNQTKIITFNSNTKEIVTLNTCK